MAGGSATQKQHALDLARRGFRVFPLKVGGKTPLWLNWQDHTSTDPDWIDKVWSKGYFNIGVVADDMIIVDVDVKNGKPGMASAMEIGLPFDTFTVQTPTGGLHLYFTGPNVANSTSKLADGIDVRSKGGYVVGPGSVIDGIPYRITYESKPIPLPRDLVTLAGQARERAKPIDIDLDQPEALAFAQDWLADHPGAVEGQGGDAHTYATACSLRDFGVSEDVAFDLMAANWNERCSPAWPLDELRIKVANAFAYATGPAGIKSPVRLFEGVHVEADPAKPPSPWHDHGDDYAGAVSWLYEGVLPKTGTVILSGASGSGKTFVALYLAKSLATGGAFFKLTPAETGGTLLLVGEAFGSVKMRLAGLGEARERLPISARYVGGLAARGAWKALCDDVRAKAATMTQPVRLIVLDTLSASNILEREDDNGQAAAVMKLFSELATELNLLFVVIHHPPKSGYGERGAGAIRNNADYVLTITQRPNETLREIETTKSRDGECKAVGAFTLVPVEIDGGRTMVVSPGEPRIKQANGAPPREHIELAARAVDWACKTRGENINWEGYSWADEDSVYSHFRDGWRGIRKDKSIVFPKFEAALRFAINLGAVEAMTLNGSRYYRGRDLN